jgi:hypothetical protein
VGKCLRRGGWLMDDSDGVFWVKELCNDLSPSDWKRLRWWTRSRGNVHVFSLPAVCLGLTIGSMNCGHNLSQANLKVCMDVEDVDDISESYTVATN